MITWILTAISIVGTWLNAKKLRCCFYIWLACNAGWLAWDIMNMVYARALLDIIQSAFCIYGIIEWGKE